MYIIPIRSLCVTPESWLLSLSVAGGFCFVISILIIGWLLWYACFLPWWEKYRRWRRRRLMRKRDWWNTLC